MQPCNRISYSTVHWRLNMFRAAYRSSSGAPTVFADSGLRTHVVTGRSRVWVGNGFSQFPHVEPSLNGGIRNSITKLHLVGYFYWFNVEVFRLEPTFLAWFLFLWTKETLLRNVSFLTPVNPTAYWVLFWRLFDDRGWWILEVFCYRKSACLCLPHIPHTDIVLTR